jgi:TolB-like protein/DNA-binding winged helix-turn-helix (wHTH) protein/tetratricopeptide (TPR) repeat protein
MADESSRVAASFDGWVLLHEPLELLRDGKRLPLQELPLQILELLTSRAGRLVTREELVTHLWPKGVVDFDAGINTAMRKLRVALGDDAAAPRYIETVPRQGYRFLVMPQCEPAPAAAGTPAVATAWRRWPLVLATVGVAIVFAMAWSVIALRRSSDPAALATQTYRLAVLPFENLSPDPENAFFADGMHEEILSSLANVPDLEVISRTTMMQYRRAPRSVTDIAKELRVTHVLEGTVRREGTLVRMTLQLIDARNDRHLWSRTFDRTLTDVMTLQSQVAVEIAGQLRRSLMLNAGPPPTRNPAAYDLWLQGVLGWQNVGGGGAAPGEFARVEDLFSRAIALDPTYAAAYADRCRVRVAIFFNGNDRSGEMVAAARADLAMAQKLAGNTPQVLVRTAQLVYFLDGDMPKALELIGEAEKSGPLSADFLMTKANFLAFSGRLEESLAAHEHAADLDPGNPTIFRFWMSNLFTARRPAEALRVAQRFDEQFPGRIDRGALLFEYTGSTTRWRQEVEREDPAGFPSTLPSIHFELLRYERRLSELKPLLSSLGAKEFRQFSPYRSVVGPVVKPLAELKGWERLLASDRAAAAREGRLVLEYVKQQPQWKWNAWANHLLAAEGALFVADHARAGSETRAALAAIGDAPDFTIGAYARLMAARVFAWSGASDEAVDLLVRLSTRHPGVGPAAITRDPLISVPLAGHAGYRQLAQQLEGEIARNQNLL